MLQVTDIDISYAENILFGRTGVFDDDRIKFIKELNTCDLHAVPGSGKTTALLAKLLIIERHLPFVSGKAILVISHTNAAVDEIKERIGKYCPKLFSDPHFIGTIQSFVDRYLAIPYYTLKVKKKPLRIDDEIYYEKVSQYNRIFFRGFTPQEQNNAKNYLRLNDRFAKIRFTATDEGYELTSSYLSEAINISKPRNNARNYVDWLDAEKDKVKEWINQFKKSILNSGYLCFDDAYFLATKYLQTIPAIKVIIQKRFAFAFVDEMQDMESYQYQVLENIFYNGGQSETSYQRIGDSNQAIFTESLDLDLIWEERNPKHELNGSHRLTPAVASVVQSLALHPIQVVGLNTNLDDNYIKPHLIIYNDSNKLEVINEFAEIIGRLKQGGSIPANAKDVYKAICWNTKQEVGKVRICDFHPAFSKEEQKLKINHSALESYLYLFDRESKSIPSIQKNILNGLLRVLRLEQITDDDNHFTKKGLLKYLQVNHEIFHREMQIQLYKWCELILMKEEDIVLTELKTFIPKLLILFNKALGNSLEFINSRHVAVPYAGMTSNGRNNFPKFGDQTIEVTTVHRAKGQTHTGTLYLESYYERNVQNLGNYESERLATSLLLQPRPPALHRHVKQSLKMAYVGFSRPTHLLCFAVHQSRFDERLANINTDIWEIIRLPQK